METIVRLKEHILALYPVRKTANQKQEFRSWLMDVLKRSGWKAREERYGKLNGSVNVIAGDPDRASVFLCAHYDTAARMLLPDFVSPTNVLAHVCYHLTVGLALAVAVLLVSFAVSFLLHQPGLMLPLFLILAVAVLGVSAYGPANQNNANGNTSGVLALLVIAGELQRDERVCLLFLDNEERNSLGASAFKKKHPGDADKCLFFNFDCVGDGEHLLLMPSRHSRWDAELLSALEAAFPVEGEMTPHVLSKGLQYYPSDHQRFKYHVAVCACRRLAGLGYYIPHLRTKRDTVLRDENIACVVRGVVRSLDTYLD